MTISSNSSLLDKAVIISTCRCWKKLSPAQVSWRKIQKLALAYSWCLVRSKKYQRWWKKNQIASLGYRRSIIFQIYHSCLLSRLYRSFIGIWHYELGFFWRFEALVKISKDQFSQQDKISIDRQQIWLKKRPTSTWRSNRLIHVN